MRDQINLTGISAIGFHGVFPEERKNGQNFIVDLKLNFGKLFRYFGFD